jgi:hypothetical protein
MKSNKKFILGIILIMMVVFNITNLYADDGISKAKETMSMLESGVSFLGGTIGKLVGANPVLHGVIGGVLSGFNTYSKLNETIKMELPADRVNISGDTDDFYGGSDVLMIDIGENVVLTDQNVLDVDFIVPRAISTFADNTKNPIMRLGERTEKVNVLDTNRERVVGQKRSLLFEDPNNTIENAYEYRTLLIEYKEAKFNKQPVDVKIKFKDISSSKWTAFFTSGVDYLKDAIVNEIDSLKKELFDHREPKESPKNVQKFNLIFNSRVPDGNDTINPEIFDCASEDGTILGTTGNPALPKVALDWQFSDQKEITAINGTKLNKLNWCDVKDIDTINTPTNDGIYCDSTQFAIEALYKINEINTFVANNSDGFICPQTFETQQLVSKTNNVGLTYLDAKIDGRKLIVTYTLEGQYNKPDSMLNTESLLDAVLTVSEIDEITELGTEISQTTENVSVSHLVNSKTTITKEIMLTGTLESSRLKVNVILDNFNDTFVDYETGDNVLDNEIEILVSQDTSACTLEKTSINLDGYAYGLSSYVSEIKDRELVQFRSYLMQDGYTQDFREDFDKIYRKEFLVAPKFYSDVVLEYMTPLYKYFLDSEKFIFKTKVGDVERDGLPGPGKYAVDIVIHYDNSWKLFDESGNITGKIEIIFDKISAPEIDMPVYYMPINGVVGINTPNSRQGYGVDYLGDKIKIDTTQIGSYFLETEGFIGSTPITTVNIKEFGPNDFKIMNTGESRGKILDIERTKSGISLKYIPSRPTPVALRVTNANNDAFAFYKLSLGAPAEQGGIIANTGDVLTYWTGFANCRDFEGVPQLERYLGTRDIVSTDSRLAPTTQSQGFSYGVEWPKEEINRYGNIWLYSIFYTPTNYKTGQAMDGISRLVIDSKDDQAYFYTLAERSSTNQSATLDGPSESIELRNALINDIESLKDIYNLVSEKKACVSPSASRLSVYYNPKSISDDLTNIIIENKLDSDTEACIKN